MISDLIKWNHNQSYTVKKFSSRPTGFSREFRFDQDDAYIMDHQIDGQKLFPAAGYILLAWEALSRKLRKNFKQLPITIENFRILRTTECKAGTPLKFFVNIQDNSGKFEIMEGSSLVARGKIYESSKLNFLESLPESTTESACVSGENIYYELMNSGYEYGASFQSIAECSYGGDWGLIQWQERWISFLEAHLVFFGLMKKCKKLMIPTGAEVFKIDPNAVLEFLQNKKSSIKIQGILTCNFPCSYNQQTNVCHSIGVEIGCVEFKSVNVEEKLKTHLLEEFIFVPYLSKYSPTDELHLHISDYYSECDELISKIETFIMSDLEQQTVIHTEETETKDKQLLKILNTIFEDSIKLKKKGEEYLSTYSHVSGRDMLNNTLLDGYSLKIMLDIISENASKKLNVIEVNRNFPIVLELALEIDEKYASQMFNKCILVASDSIGIDQSLLTKSRIQRCSNDSLKELEKERLPDVAISSFTCGPLSDLSDLIHFLVTIVKPNGFILLFFKEKPHRLEERMSSICGAHLQVRSVTELEKLLKSENLLILSKISDPFGGSVYLLRAPHTIEKLRFLHITDENCDWVEKARNELHVEDLNSLWLVAEDRPVNSIPGMVNCLKQELRGDRIRCILNTHKKQENHFPSFSIEDPFFQLIIKKNLVTNVWNNGTWGSYRYVNMKKTKLLRPVEHSYLSLKKCGDFSSFEWLEASVKYVPRHNRQLIHIYYSAINFQDVMTATGNHLIGEKLHHSFGNSELGVEFSGIEEATGKRICGFAPRGTMATTILSDPLYYFEVPQKWNLEDAATVPLAYAICYYSLIIRAELQPVETILIHSGCGAIGTAAITIALSLNCKVFTTVGNDEKRAYLKNKFPQIKEEDIGCSRDNSFESMILSRTNGRGVDMILNPFVDDKYQANFRCIAQNGRIIDIGKHDLAMEHPIGDKMLQKNASLHAVFLDDLFEAHSKGRDFTQSIVDMIMEGIESGVVQPLDRTVFDLNTVEEAFRYMTNRIHIGKVLLKIRDEEADRNVLPKPFFLPAVPITQFYHNKVYIIIGGLRGLGIQITKWAIERGAKNIILTSRQGARTHYQDFCLNRWKSEGYNIQVSTLNVIEQGEAEKLLEEAMDIGPLGGIFNAEELLIDVVEDDQAENCKVLCGSNSEVSKNLDELTRNLCPDIDYFVCFLPLIAGRGQLGKMNCGFANTMMNSICYQRRRDGLHGLAIQWGIIGDKCVNNKDLQNKAMNFNVTVKSVKSCLHTLDIFCQQNSAVVASYVLA